MPNNVEDQLQEILTAQIKCQNEQDLPGAMRLIHEESFSFGPTQQLFMKLFAMYQIEFVLLEQKLLAIDGDYAFLRFKVKSEKVEGPEFKNNITDSIAIFKKLDGRWKIWCQSPINFLPI